MNKQHHHRRPDGIDPVARSRSRRRALQAIYAVSYTHLDVYKRQLQVGAQVNIEVDLLARYVERLLATNKL